MPTSVFSKHRLSIAPMMGYSDRHFHQLMYLLCPDAFLYTEMVTTQQLLHARERFCSIDQSKRNPIGMQLAGCEPQALAEAACTVEALGYDEVNLNVGCPSHRVRAARLGACLMKEPNLVADCLAAMVESVSIPVTIKTRIGVDEQDIEQTLSHFMDQIAKTGVSCVMLHARKAWLNGLNPKENRHKPPLCYERVYRLKEARPDLEIIINGGIVAVDQAAEHVRHVDGVMIGRAAYQNPYLLTQLQQALFSECVHEVSREDVVSDYMTYIEAQLDSGESLGRMTRHVLGMFHGAVGARKWRRYISEYAHKKGATAALLDTAMAERYARQV